VVRPKTSRPKKLTKKAVVARTTGSPTGSRRDPALKPRPVSKESVPVAAAGSDSSSILLPLAFGVALGFSLLAVVFALTPPWALPGQLLTLVDGRREGMIFGGFATALCISLVLGISLALS
jgi:hypothetical protein